MFFSTVRNIYISKYEAIKTWEKQNSQIYLFLFIYFLNKYICHMKLVSLKKYKK